MKLANYIRNVPDFPSPGVLFKDITPLLKSDEAFSYAIDLLVDHYVTDRVDAICGIESRGFLLAAPLALRLHKPLILLRKESKLPLETRQTDYELEYGTGILEIHTDAVDKGQNILIVDDLIATGGTMAAAIKLIELSGGTVAELAVLVELTEMNARETLSSYNLFSLVKY